MQKAQRNQEAKDAKQRLKEHDAKIDRQYKEAKIKQAAEEKTEKDAKKQQKMDTKEECEKRHREAKENNERQRQEFLLRIKQSKTI